MKGTTGGRLSTRGAWVGGAAVVALLALVPGAALGQVEGYAASGGGDLCEDDRARAFDFWIGEWNVLNRQRRPEGTVWGVTGTATDRVYPVVGGCGIVEHWRGDAAGQFIIGFSIRSWDPDEEEWKLVLLWPGAGPASFFELSGTFRHGRGEFFIPLREAPNGDSIITRYTFSDIGPDALRWEAENSRDRGRSWSGGWIMEFSRRDPGATGLLNGPAMTTRRCPGEAHRTFDLWLGEWRGTRTTPGGGEGVTVAVEMTRILEGCAVMERVRSADGSWEAFRVRSWDEGREAWVEYELSSEDRRLIRRVGGSDAMPEASGALPTLVTGGASSPRTRIRRRILEGGGLEWTVESSGIDGGPWTELWTVELTEPLGALPSN